MPQVRCRTQRCGADDRSVQEQRAERSTWLTGAARAVVLAPESKNDPGGGCMALYNLFDNARHNAACRATVFTSTLRLRLVEGDAWLVSRLGGQDTGNAVHADARQEAVNFRTRRRRSIGRADRRVPDELLSMEELLLNHIRTLPARRSDASLRIPTGNGKEAEDLLVQWHTGQLREGHGQD